MVSPCIVSDTPSAYSPRGFAILSTAPSLASFARIFTLRTLLVTNVSWPESRTHSQSIPQMQPCIGLLPEQEKRGIKSSKDIEAPRIFLALRITPPQTHFGPLTGP